MTHVTGLKNGPNDAPNKNSQKPDQTGENSTRHSHCAKVIVTDSSHIKMSPHHHLLGYESSHSRKRTGKQANRLPQTTNNCNLVLCVKVEPLLEIQILVSIPGRNYPG